MHANETNQVFPPFERVASHFPARRRSIQMSGQQYPQLAGATAAGQAAMAVGMYDCLPSRVLVADFISTFLTS